VKYCFFNRFEETFELIDLPMSNSPNPRK